jgi:hypothetical protein
MKKFLFIFFVFFMFSCTKNKMVKQNIPKNVTDTTITTVELSNPDGFYKIKSEIWLYYKYINYDPSKTYNKFESQMTVVKLYENYCVLDGVIIEGYWKNTCRFESYDGTILQISQDIVTYKHNFNTTITYSKCNL